MNDNANSTQIAAIFASSPPETPHALPEFHVAVTAQPGLVDWSGICKSMEHLLSNKVEQGCRITVHGLTRSVGAHLATLWAIGAGHNATHAPRSPAIMQGCEQNLARLHDEHPAMPLIVFMHDNLPILDPVMATAHKINIHQRIISCARLDHEPPDSPLKTVVSGQMKSYGSSYRIGRFYAPKARPAQAALWLNKFLEDFAPLDEWEGEPEYPQFDCTHTMGDFKLTDFTLGHDGWWRFVLEREWLD